MHNDLISEEQLQAWLHYDARPADVERWLKQNKVKYWHGKGGCVVTTMQAINHALGLPSNSPGHNIQQANKLEFINNGPQPHDTR